MNNEKNELHLVQVSKCLKLYTSADSNNHKFSERYVTWREMEVS